LPKIPHNFVNLQVLLMLLVPDISAVGCVTQWLTPLLLLASLLLLLVRDVHDMSTVADVLSVVSNPAFP
jgi:hypothetical protein